MTAKRDKIAAVESQYFIEAKALEVEKKRLVGYKITANFNELLMARAHRAKYCADIKLIKEAN